jgi:hypothetical protein
MSDIEQQPDATINAGNGDEHINPSSLNNMFTELLGEIKNLSSGMAALHERCLLCSDAEQDEGMTGAIDENTEADDESWLHEELAAQQNVDQDTDQLSISTRLNKLITTTQAQQTTPKQQPTLLTTIAQDVAVEEKTGEAVNEELAAIISSLLKERLLTPRVNPLIWGQISASIQTGNAKSQKNQHVFIGAVSAITKATDHILKKGGDPELLTMLTDSIAFMLQCNHEYNHSRRLAMKKRTPQGLCCPLQRSNPIQRFFIWGFIEGYERNY